MKFYGKIHNGQIVFPAMQKTMRDQYLSALKDDTPVIEEITRYRKPKSQQQLGAWWGLYCQSVFSAFEDNGWDSSFLLKLDKPTGIACTNVLLKEYLYAVCPMVDDGGNRITISKATSAQMAKWFNDCRNWAASQWDIFVPEPDPRWRTNRANKTLENGAE